MGVVIVFLTRSVALVSLLIVLIELELSALTVIRICASCVRKKLVNTCIYMNMYYTCYMYM